MAWRKPVNRLGWILLALGASSVLAEDASFYVVASYRLRHGTLPLGWVALLAQPTWSVAIVLVGLVVLLFPDGRCPLRAAVVLWVYLVMAAVWMVSAFGFTVSAIARHDIHVDPERYPPGPYHPTGSAAWSGNCPGLGDPGDRGGGLVSSGGPGRQLPAVFG